MENRQEFMTPEYTTKVSDIIKFEINQIKNKLYKRDLEMEDTILMMGEDANIKYEPIENLNLSLVERQKLKMDLEMWNKYSTMYPIDVYDDIIGKATNLVKQLEKEHSDALEKMKTANRNLGMAESQLKQKKMEYMNLAEDTYENNQVNSSQAKKIPELKKLLDKLNKDIPMLRKEYQQAKEPEVIIGKKLETAKKDLLSLKKQFQPTQQQQQQQQPNPNNGFGLTTIKEEPVKAAPKCWLCEDGECTCD
jgi:chromosome segregation ATPase